MKRRKSYQPPLMTAHFIRLRATLLAGSPEAELQGSATLNDAWKNTGKDAWDGSSSSGGGGSLGGWTDNGGSAWE